MINFHLSNLNSELLKLKINGCLKAKWRPDLKHVVFFAVTTEFCDEFQMGIIRLEKRLCLTTELDI